MGILLKERTALLPPLSAVSAILCILLNLWWIPRFGMMGAAWATVVAYFIYTMLLTIASQRLYPPVTPGPYCPSQRGGRGDGSGPLRGGVALS